MTRSHLSRRHLLAATSALLALPPVARARTATDITWDDLIPPGIPYAEIIGEGEMDYINDTWFPVYDENARKMNDALNGAYIRMPGYVIPLEMDARGVTEFILVPYVGACIHVPPPPPNQLVYVKTKEPWPSETLWDAVWVVGELSTSFRDTDIAVIGYELAADGMEVFTWPD
ncbi:MAG: DUF3299 domain-containing protein [Pseudomonadota bacterium]